MNILNKLKKAIIGANFEIEPIKQELILNTSKEFIVEILNSKEFIYTDIGYLLLVVPELWKDFNLEDWLYVIRNVNREKNYRILINSEPCFEDIRFLHNWIGIDSIDLYKNDIGISDENKKSLDIVFPEFLTDTLRNGEVYMEDFSDGTFGDINYFKEMHESLLSQGASKSLMGKL